MPIMSLCNDDHDDEIGPAFVLNRPTMAPTSASMVSDVIPTDRDDAPKITWQAYALALLETLGVALQRISESETVKIFAVVFDCVYALRMIPYVIKCMWHQATCKLMWRDMSYGPRPRNMLDVYFPSRGQDAGRLGKAVILFVHGGAWYWGTKTYFSRIQASSFPDCTVVVINYTLHPHGACEQMVEDISRSIRWTLQQFCRPDRTGRLSDLPPMFPLASAAASAVDELATDCTFRPPPLVLVGHSAGAHLVALALTRRCGLADLAAGCGRGAGDVSGEEGADGFGWEPEEVGAFVGIRCGDWLCGCARTSSRTHVRAEPTQPRRAAPVRARAQARARRSGVYHIAEHRAFEARRGVADISPMCGTRRNMLTPAGR